MPKIDIGAPIVTMCEPEPSARIYEPMDIWVIEVGEAPPQGAALIYVRRIGRGGLVNVYARPAIDDREDKDGNPTTVRTYH